MPLPITLHQISLSLSILASTIGTYISLSPPHPRSPTSLLPPTSTNDLISALNLTSKHSTLIVLSPLLLLSLHTSPIIFYYPHIPPFLLFSNEKKEKKKIANLNKNLITWSPSTITPLLLIFGVGIPLRLIPYASLGKDFTFELTSPRELVKEGIYKYVQHPSYVGIAILVLGNFALLGRIDGVLRCWIQGGWYKVVRRVYWAVVPVGIAVIGAGIWMRVLQEERMLRGVFGREWEVWNRETARFVPGMF